MPKKFDPVRSRKFWLDTGLATWFDFSPQEIPPLGQTSYLQGMVDGFIKTYLLGLADRVRPTLEKMIDWMETHPESDPHQFSREYGHWRAGWTELYMRGLVLGLCKWLSRSDPAERDFSRALQAEWHSWTVVSPGDAEAERAELEYHVPQYLAVALAAKNPELGLKLLALADMKEPFEEHLPMIEFGEWACRHLAAGGKRDAEFVSRGVEMLRKAPPDFFTDVRRDEAVLWLKAIYWDSGIVRTPEQTIAKAYEFIPGVARPDFVPG